ncbi:PepSY domain-containing protein [Maricaulis sp.]|uniref:PepSY-associated TM helix domain-containing protein n=1 Tax=Maricaulis sp. TaxID=1486257 RepID=UPI001B0EABDE|nr:PepSY-associated TM helix domain-containing protein [Maricaulis sp.]MBO6765134.1 PepSY domain-containing protein [Maricaulis sp.]
MDAQAVTREVTAPAGKKAKARSAWWRVHQWAGLQLSLFLTFVFLTGTLAVFSYEIDWALRPAMWAAPTAIEGRAGWGAVGETVMAETGGEGRMIVYAPVHPAATFDAVLRRDGISTHVYVHPRTGEITGTGPWAGVQRFLRNTHRHLMLPVKYGVPIVALAAVFLAVSLVTSFWVYKKWWRGFLRLPRGRTARAWIGDAHRVAGVWSLWFVLVMIVTGLWYLVEVLGAGAPAANGDDPDLPQTAALERELGTGEAIDAGIAALMARHPDFRIEAVFWPPDRETPAEVHGYTGRAILVRPRANTAWIDPRTGVLLDVVDPARLSAHQRIAEAADPLHFGTFGGYWTKALWFLFGVALTALAGTGVAIYALRLAKTARETPGWRRGLARSWRAMGPARWIAAGLVILPFALTPFVL